MRKALKNSSDQGNIILCNGKRSQFFQQKCTLKRLIRYLNISLFLLIHYNLLPKGLEPFILEL